MATVIDIDLFSGHDYSDLVLGGIVSTDLGAGKREITLTKTSSMQLGSMVKADGTEAATGDEAVGVLVWANLPVAIKDLADGDQFTGVVIERGYTLNRYLVVGTDGKAISDEVCAQLEAKGLKLTEKVLTTS